jgi:exodeoxyribonuclease VII large subunit
VVIVARGGGDATALLPWSSEEVCMAVAAAPVPVVSAIGHDGDRPLCDEVADLRCGTPSIAAAAVVPDRDALTARCDALLARAADATHSRCERATQRHRAVVPAGALRAGIDRAVERMDRAGQRLAWVHPAVRVEAASARIAAQPWRRAAWEQLARASGRIDADARHLRALAPERVLDRGYAVVRREDGTVVRRRSEVADGQLLEVTVRHGRFAARVEGHTTEEGR